MYKINTWIYKGLTKKLPPYENILSTCISNVAEVKVILINSSKITGVD